VAYW